MSLLMEALKRAEREKHIADTNESAQGKGSAGPDKSNWLLGPEQLQDKDRFSLLRRTKPTPGDSAPEAMAFPAAPTLTLEARPAESAPAATTATPPLANETSIAQRQQHAADVLAATRTMPVHDRALPAAVGTAAILLLAGGAYLYWLYPKLSSALDQGGLHVAPIVPAHPYPESRFSPPQVLATTATPASNSRPAYKRLTPPPPAATLAERAPKEWAIAIRRDSHEDQVAPALSRGYSAFIAGDDRLAQMEYASILRQDGNNRDALLGMAAIAARRGQRDEAVRTYLHLQELDPRDAAAQAGILSLTADEADPVQSESRVKILLAQLPDAHFLHFTLGNLYAGQSRWAEAQQAFFNAYQKLPSNPDYVYNLAISLDHLNQGKLALEYYQRALSLPGPENFDKAAAQNRAKELHTIFHGSQSVESRSPLGLRTAGN